MASYDVFRNHTFLDFFRWVIIIINSMFIFLNKNYIRIIFADREVEYDQRGFFSQGVASSRSSKLFLT
jgi:uncharacterized membrane protein YhdT